MLSVGTLATVRELKAVLSVPLIVPAQHRLAVDDAHVLAALDVEAILLGAVVTGAEPESIESATNAFVVAVSGA